MPLLDHFHPPWSVRRPWQSIHSAWATEMTLHLNHGLLPAGYFAVPNVQLGVQVETDVATMANGGVPGAAGGAGGVATAVWAPSRPTLSVAVDFTGVDVFEVQVFLDEGGPQLRAAVELVSPANKDRAAHRQAFAIKCASYLQQQIGVVVVDCVSNRSGNLHCELFEALHMAAGSAWESPTGLYAAAYHTTAPNPARLDAWLTELRLGAALPTVPLWLAPDVVVPLDLERSYAATCETLLIR